MMKEKLLSKSASATIRDVARHADVSVASVSRALNGHSNVHPDTRARVRSSAEALGYVPHAGARSLSMARTQAIGIVLPDLHGEFFSEIVRGMDRETGDRGYHMLLSNMHADADLAARAMRSMRGRVDGLIVMAPQIATDGLAHALPPGIPAMLVNSPETHGQAAIRVDNRAGIETVVRHLLSDDRQALVHIAGPSGNIDARERREAFATCMAQYAGGQPIRIVEGDFREQSGAEAVAGLLRSGEPVDGIIAANDMMALGALRALREAGVTVPDTVALTGFDDIPLARYIGLTTVRVHLADLGARAAARLIDAIETTGSDDRSSGTEWVTPQLIVRGTTKEIGS